MVPTSCDISKAHDHGDCCWTFIIWQSAYYLKCSKVYMISYTKIYSICHRRNLYAFVFVATTIIM